MFARRSPDRVGLRVNPNRKGGIRGELIAARLHLIRLLARVFHGCIVLDKPVRQVPEYEWALKLMNDG